MGGLPAGLGGGGGAGAGAFPTDSQTNSMSLSSSGFLDCLDVYSPGLEVHRL